MMSIKKKIASLLHSFEKTLGSLKAAVVIITLFIISLIIGTFAESLYGTEFASKLIYRSVPFMLLQLLLFLSIYFAAALRLPYKKRLLGFYLTHLGLITLLAGSFITYKAGIDGQTILHPNQLTAEVELTDKAKFVIQNETQGEKVSMYLPSSPFSSKVNVSHKDILVKKYIPFGERVVEWKKADSHLTSSFPSTTYFLVNAFTSQEITLSASPLAQEFESSATLGPLTLHYLPTELYSCFANLGPSKILVYNAKEKICFIPEERKIEIKQTEGGKKFLAFKENNVIHAFIPEVRPFDLDENLQPRADSPYKVFDLKIFESSPNLFLFGESLSYFSQEEDKWKTHELKRGQSRELPWMKMTIETITHHQDLYPAHGYVSVLPIFKNNEIVKGGEKAILVEMKGQEFWVSSRFPQKVKTYPDKQGLQREGQELRLSIENDSLQLPFSLVLKEFIMKKDPGTNNPASFESFVNVIDSRKSSKKELAHIYMNNPLKKDDFTLYQASYFPLQDERGNPKEDEYGSVLTVNYDPGRPIKYAGSLLIVFGAALHFWINRKKKEKVLL